LWRAKDELMKLRTALSFLPLFTLTAPALAQVPVAPAPAPAPAAAPLPAPAGVVATPAGEAVPAAATPPPATEPGKGDAPPDRLTIAKTGFLQPSLNLQAWAIAEHLGNARTDENAWQSTFRIRRAEVKFKGEIIPKKVGYMVMFDPARLLDFKSTSADVKDADGATLGTVPVVGPPGAQNGSTIITGASSSILQDVQLTYMTDYADFSIGQFKIPVSLEGAGSASKLYFPERSLVSRRFGDRRDIGLKVEKKFDKFSYWFGVYNGEGQNNLDSNDQKDLALRVEVYPIKELTVAAVGYVSVGDRDRVNTKDRIEGDIKFEKYGFLLQAEAIRGWDVVGSAAAHRRISGQGFYVLAGYTFFGNLQPVVRIGSVDPEIGADERGSTDVKAAAATDEMTAYEFGVNYYVKQHDVKFQLAGSFFDPEQRAAKTTFDLILAAQIAL
jgi:Phosphate-selective porin O and P